MRGLRFCCVRVQLNGVVPRGRSDDHADLLFALQLSEPVGGLFRPCEELLGRVLWHRVVASGGVLGTRYSDHQHWLPGRHVRLVRPHGRKVLGGAR